MDLYGLQTAIPLGTWENFWEKAVENILGKTKDTHMEKFNQAELDRWSMEDWEDGWRPYDSNDILTQPEDTEDDMKPAPEITMPIATPKEEEN